MIYGSVCSGIEAATVAWAPLGWAPSFFSDIEPFPRAVLEHHYPDVPLHGDFTTIERNQYGKIDLLVGGTPCQAFSVAGLRKGLDDERGNLTLEFVRMVQREQPRWLVWENVPGVLSSNGGRDFGSFLGALVELGYGFAYRVLDAQYYGVPQRRRRVYVVGHLADERGPSAVLFERESMLGNPAPSREAGQDPTAGVVSSLDASYGRLHGTSGQDLNHNHSHLVARFRAFGDYEMDETVSPIKRRDHHKRITDIVMEHIDGGDTARPLKARHDGMPTADGLGYDVIAIHGTQDPDLNDIAHPLGRNQGQENAIFVQNSRSEVREMEYSGAVAANPGVQQQHYVRQDLSVRRLTPIECERLQGFPDNYTQIPWRNRGAEHCPDGHRYRALGNSMAVPVMRWIGSRIEFVDRLMRAVGVE